jgi:hypothetical protein
MRYIFAHYFINRRNLMAKPKSEIERKFFGFRLNPALIIGIKILAAKRERPVNQSLEEAISEYLAKNGETVQNKATQF